MGNTCDLEGQCCQVTETPNQFRSREEKERNTMAPLQKIGLKDLVKIKKMAITEDYVVLSPAIGKGSFGSVFKIVNKQSGLIWAAKRIPINSSMDKHVQEMVILKQLDHPNIIRIIDVYQQELYVYVIMELCNGGQLFERIVERQNMNQSTARIYMQQLLSAVAYCHMNRIIHRDLKPENIMMVSSKEDTLKVIDFGASIVYKKGEVNSLKVGSVYYIAPEVIKKSYTEKCDLWSLGVILYMMLSGTPPFNGRTDKDIFQKILQGKISFPNKQWEKISQQGKDLIRKLLELDPQKRVSARQALCHPWILSPKKEEEKNIYLSNQLYKIKQFCSMNKFKQSIMTYIAHNMSTVQSLQKMRKKFQQIDLNNDGRISWKQFQKCYYQNMEPITIDQLMELFAKLDTNQSGYIDYSEFIALVSGQHMLESRDIIQKAFDMIDKDKDGFLDKQEIFAALGGLEEALYEQMLSQCDLNKDGLISKDQFMATMFNVSDIRIKGNNIGINSTKGSNEGYM